MENALKKSTKFLEFVLEKDNFRIYKIIKAGTISEIFGSLSSDIKKLAILKVESPYKFKEARNFICKHKDLFSNDKDFLVLLALIASLNTGDLHITGLSVNGAGGMMVGVYNGLKWGERGAVDHILVRCS